MAKLRLVSWQEALPQESAPLRVDFRALSPVAKADKATARFKPLSPSGLLLAMFAHAAVFGILFYASNSKPEIEKVTTPPVVVSLIAAPQPEPVPEAEIVQPEPPKPEPKPIVKQKPKPIPKPVPKPEPVVKPTPVPEPQLQETPPPAIAEQESVEPEPMPQPVAAAPLVEEAQPEPQPEPEPVIEPPRFGVSYLNNPPPAYPALSRRMGEEGRVMLRVLVGANGKPEKVEIENGSGSQRLDNAALDAVKKWQFIPARRNNEAISAFVLVPVKFSLDS